MAEDICIVIADDDEQVRAHIQELVGSQKHLKVIAEAGNSRDAMALVKHHRPALVLLDIEMPGMDGLQALKRIRQDNPQTHVMIVSSSTDRASVKEAQKFGARGYVAKQDLEEDLILAIKAVIAGNRFLSRAVRQETPRSIKKESGTNITEMREVNMMSRQHHDTAVLSTCAMGSEPDSAALSEAGLIRVLVVEDEPSAMKNICEVLGEDKRIQIVGCCEDVETAIKLIDQQSPTIVLLDLDLWRDESGGWQVVRKNHLRVHVIICTRSKQRADVSEAWRQGVAGYVPKEVLDTELIQAICSVHARERYFSESLGKLAVRCRGILEALSDTERDVFSLFVRDCLPKKIAEALCMSNDTVGTHMFNIRGKIGHQHGWKGVAKEARKEDKAHKTGDALKYSILLKQFTERERNVFDRYVEDLTGTEKLAAACRIPVMEVKDLMREIRRKLNCPPNGWKDIAMEEGDI